MITKTQTNHGAAILLVGKSEADCARIRSKTDPDCPVTVVAAKDYDALRRYHNKIASMLDETEKDCEQARELCRSLWDLARSAALATDIDISNVEKSLPKWIYNDDVLTYCETCRKPFPNQKFSTEEAIPVCICPPQATIAMEVEIHESRRRFLTIQVTQALADNICRWTMQYNPTADEEQAAIDAVKSAQVIKEEIMHDTYEISSVDFPENAEVSDQ